MKNSYIYHISTCLWPVTNFVTSNVYHMWIRQDVTFTLIHSLYPLPPPLGVLEGNLKRNRENLLYLSYSYPDCEQSRILWHLMPTTCEYGRTWPLLWCRVYNPFNRPWGCRRWILDGNCENLLYLSYFHLFCDQSRILWHLMFTTCECDKMWPLLWYTVYNPCTRPWGCKRGNLDGKCEKLLYSSYFHLFVASHEFCDI